MVNRQLSDRPLVIKCQTGPVGRGMRAGRFAHVHVLSCMAVLANNFFLSFRLFVTEHAFGYIEELPDDVDVCTLSFI